MRSACFLLSFDHKISIITTPLNKNMRIKGEKKQQCDIGKKGTKNSPQFLTTYKVDEGDY